MNDETATTPSNNTEAPTPGASTETTTPTPTPTEPVSTVSEELSEPKPAEQDPSTIGFRAVSLAPNEFVIHHNGRDLKGLRLTPQDCHIVLAWLNSLPAEGV